MSESEVHRLTDEFVHFTQDLVFYVKDNSVSLQDFFVQLYPQYLAKMDELLREFNASAPQPVQCGPSCNACCNNLVYVMPLEAAYIWFRLLNEKTEEEVGEFLEQIQKRASFQEKLRKNYPDTNEYFKHYLKSQVPCQFVDESDSCGIYSYRPAMCRNHNVLSPADLCDDVLEIHQTKVWRHPILWKVDHLMQKEISKHFLASDKADSMQNQLLKFAPLGLKQLYALNDGAEHADQSNSTNLM